MRSAGAFPQAERFVLVIDKGLWGDASDWVGGKKRQAESSSDVTPQRCGSGTQSVL